MNKMNSRKQGDVGVAAAVLHFTKLGYTVSMPVTEASRYDLIVDMAGHLYRVQCKTSSYFRDAAQTYEVSLSTAGGNRSWTGVVKHLDSSEIDLVFIYCLDESQYVLPASVLHGKASLRMGSKQQKYRVQ